MTNKIFIGIFNEEQQVEKTYTFDCEENITPKILNLHNTPSLTFLFLNAKDIEISENTLVNPLKTRKAEVETI